MFAKEVYINRRSVLKTKVGSGILLFLGTGEAAVNYAGNTYRYRQDSTFNYYFGLTDPDLAAVIDLESGEEIIFGNDVDIDDIIWMGPQPLISDKAASVGVSKSFPFAELEKYVSKAKAQGRKVHFLPPYRYRNMILLNQMLGVPFDRMRAEASEEFIKAVVSMRLIKEQREIEEIDKACNIGYAMHFTAMKMARLGMSFPTILSQHGETLHNHKHDGILTDGKLIVIDAGAESNTNYCSDFTRTIPSSGKFTTKQKEIYDIVSAANNLAQSVARPGITYTEVHQAVSRLMAQGLINLGILKGDPDEILLEKEYYDFGGIRLEDDILITEKGCRLLGSKRLPITTEDVEREMADNSL